VFSDGDQSFGFLRNKLGAISVVKAQPALAND
jgi:hypothetical protein